MTAGRWKVQAALNQGRAHKNRWARRLAWALAREGGRAREAAWTMDDLVEITSVMTGQPVQAEDFRVMVRLTVLGIPARK